VAGRVLRDRRGACAVFFSVRYLVEQNLMVKAARHHGAAQRRHRRRLHAGGGGKDRRAHLQRERLFLLAAGFNAQGRHPATADHRDPMPPARQGMVCRLRRCLVLLRAAGWGQEGVPSEAKLRQLGLL